MKHGEFPYKSQFSHGFPMVSHCLLLEGTRARLATGPTLGDWSLLLPGSAEEHPNRKWLAFGPKVNGIMANNNKY